jgi:hypothetical protein
VVVGSQGGGVSFSARRSARFYLALSLFMDRHPRQQKMLAQTDGSLSTVHRRLRMTRQGAHPFRARGNLCARRRRRPGVLVQMKLHLLLLSLLSAHLLLPVTPHAQKTAASERIESNRPGCDRWSSVRKNAMCWIFGGKKVNDSTSRVEARLQGNAGQKGFPARFSDR